MTVLDTIKGEPGRAKGLSLERYIPSVNWLPGYHRADLSGDLIAGLVVAIMLVPQSMAYAQLAGLPPQSGLYASIIPLIIYGLLGTSRTLSVAPVAIASLLVMAGLNKLATPGSPEYIQLALTLALLVGLMRMAMGLVRLGFLVNFLSQPVLSGYTSAAALIIGFSQLKHLLGIPMPNIEQFFSLVAYASEHMLQTNPVTLLLGAGSIVILLVFNNFLGPKLKQWGMQEPLRLPLVKSAPLLVVLLGTVVVWGWGLDQQAGVKVVGSVPAGLPALTWPLLEWHTWQVLLPTALIVAFVGYMESISVAKALASRRRQKVDPNQELIALGAANLGAAFSGGYPVNGGFSRSVVNFNAGANTGLASIITAGLVALTVIFLTPLFYFLPQAALAAIIMVSVFGLVDLAALRHVWRYNKADAAALLITFATVLAFGVETGIGVGVTATILLFLWRTSRPHVAIVGRLGQSETYRNILRHPVKTCPHVVAMRVDESLYFANTKFLEDTVLRLVADQPEVKHLVLIGIAINFIDASALETLESLLVELQAAGVEFHLAEIKGPVMDRLKAIGFVDKIGANRIHLSTHEAMTKLGCI
jgi:SulP family sulfate permease